MPTAGVTIGPDGVYLHGARIVGVQPTPAGVRLDTLGPRELPRTIALQVVVLILEGLTRLEAGSGLERAVTRSLGWDADESRVEAAVAALCEGASP